jgi:prepilin-type processing-associated H-X9-DG protein
MLKKEYYSFNEAIVTFSAIVMLLSLCLKSLIVTQEKAKGTNCSMHLKSIFGATMMYASDYQDRLPHEDTGGRRPPYESSWTQVLEISPFEMGIPYLGYNLKMNSRLEEYKGNKKYLSDPFFHLPSALKPSNSPYIFDGRVDNSYAYFMFGTPSSVAPRHSDESNFLFLDGSAYPVWEVPNPTGGWDGLGNLPWDALVPVSEQ